MPDALAGRDIGAVFQFLHQRGWSWAAIAQATDIGEQRVREIANGKRRVENYDVYVRVAVGLNIPRDYLGVGLRPPDQRNQPPDAARNPGGELCTGGALKPAMSAAQGRERIAQDFGEEEDGTTVPDRIRKLDRSGMDPEIIEQLRDGGELLSVPGESDIAAPGIAEGSQLWVPGLADARSSAKRLWASNHALSRTQPGPQEPACAAALSWLVAPPDPALAQATGRRHVGMNDVARLRAVRAHLKGIDNAYGGGTAFPMAAMFLRHNVTPLLDSSYSEATGSQLLAAVAELGLDAGWMAYDAGDHALARRYMTQALRLSHAAGDRLLGGRVLAAMSHQALHLQQTWQAVDLARAARSGTRGTATPTVTAMLAAMEACAHAVAGDQALAQAALAAAESALGRARPGDENPPWLDFDEGGLWGHAARAFRDLGKPLEAQRYARLAIQLCNIGHGRTRAQRTAILATASLQAGDAEEAAILGLDLVRQCWSLESQHVREDVAVLATELGAAATQAGSEFLSEARDLITAPVSAAKARR